MLSDFTLDVLRLVPFGVVSLTLIGLGLYQLVRRRPVILHAGWRRALFVVAMSPLFIRQLSQLFDGGRHRRGVFDLVDFILLSVMLILFSYVVLQMRGYSVLGVTRTSFRAALLSALASLDLVEHEETLSSIRLPSVPAELYVTVSDWIGSGQLRLRSGGRPGLLADIARGMGAHFGSAQVETNMTTAIFDLIIGVLIGALALLLTINR